MNKKHVIITSLMLLLMFSVSSLVAASDVSINGNSLTIGDFQFKIPDGYTENQSQRQIDSIDSSGNYKDTTTIFNDGDKKINITLRASADGGEISDYANTYGTNETIAGIAGSYLTDTTKITDNKVAFLYAKNGKGIYISAPDKETIEKILG